MRERAMVPEPEFESQAEDGVTYAEKIGPADRELDLARPADVSVTLLGARGMPLRTFHLAAGSDGTQAGHHELTVWDGLDAAGQDAPAGEYWVAVSLRAGDGAVENKRFRLVKP